MIHDIYQQCKYDIERPETSIYVSVGKHIPKEHQGQAHCEVKHWIVIIWKSTSPKTEIISDFPSDKKAVLM